MFPMHSSGPCLQSTPSFSVGLERCQDPPKHYGDEHNLRANIRKCKVDFINDTLHRWQDHHSKTILWDVRLLIQTLLAESTFASGHLLMMCASRGTRACSLWLIVTGVAPCLPQK
jgi:hypothetical protein